MAFYDISDYRNRIADLHQSREVPRRQQTAAPRQIFNWRRTGPRGVIDTGQHVALFNKVP